MNKIIIAAFCLSLILMSCVSSGKYDAMTFQRDSLKLLSDSLKRADDSLSNMVFNDIGKVKMIRDQNSALHQNINDLELQNKQLNEKYIELKSNSTSENQQLVDKLEAMKADIALRENKINEIQGKLQARDSVVNALRKRINDALLGFTNSGLSVSIKDGKVYVSLSNQLLFKTGSTSIDKKGLEALKGLAEVLNQQPDINVLVEGHTDDQKILSGSRFKDNWDLSVMRATEVVRYLTVDCSVDPTRVIASGRSEYFPVEKGDTPEARASNRRTEIILTPKLEELFEIIKK